MSRTALRLAAIAALTNGGNEPYPTLAKKYVYDSRADAIDDIRPKERRAVIIVRTEDDTREMGSEHVPALRQSRRTADLVLDLSIVTASRDQNGNLIAGWPETDSALEAWLDALEHEADIALFGSGLWADWIRGIRLFYPGRIESRPEYSEPGRAGVRLAARRVRYEGIMRLDGEPKPVIEGDDVPDPELPPILMEVFNKIENEGGGDLKIAAAQLRASLESRDLPVAPVYPRLRLVRADIARSPETGESLTAELLGDIPPEDL